MITAAGLADPGTLLAAWEAAAGATGHRRGPALAAALGAEDSGDLLDRPLARLGARLGGSHAAAFGRHVAGVITCSECAAELDVEVDLAELFPAGGGEPAPPAGPGGLTVRAPTTRDLIAAAGSADAATEIVRRCVRGPDGNPVRLADLSEAERALVDDELARRTGPGLPTLRTTCPECGAAVVAFVDPGVLLWSAVRSRVTSMLQDVADLAAAFGWREADVLALPPRRRAAYLELARLSYLELARR